MPLQLKFNNQFLVFIPKKDVKPGVDSEDEQQLVIITESGTKLPVRLSRTSHGFRQAPQISFTTRLCNLPGAFGDRFREEANKIQKDIHDNAPRFAEPRRGGLIPDRDDSGRRRRPRPIRRAPQRIALELPPETIELEDDHIVALKTLATYRDKPCLEVGDLVTFEGIDELGPTREFGTTLPGIELRYEHIEAFELN